jgi:hypothetical protein
MLLKTHYVFSTGVLTPIGLLFLHSFYDALLLAGVVSVVANTVIDRLGHEMVWAEGRTIPRRTPLTHTYPRSVLWGLLVSVGVLSLLYFGDKYLFRHHGEELIITGLLYGVLVGPSHMFLDMFTERGIYVRDGKRWRRFALAHFRFNDPLANGLAVMAGVLLIMFSSQI